MDKHNILVVEDDRDIQQLVSYNLIRSGFNVTCAALDAALQTCSRAAAEKKHLHYPALPA